MGKIKEEKKDGKLRIATKATTGTSTKKTVNKRKSKKLHAATSLPFSEPNALQSFGRPHLPLPTPIPPTVLPTSEVSNLCLET